MGCHHQGKLKRQPYDTCSSEFLHAICGDDNADTDARANAIAIAIVNANVEADDERLTAAVAACSKGELGTAWKGGYPRRSNKRQSAMRARQQIAMKLNCTHNDTLAEQESEAKGCGVEKREVKLGCRK